MENQDKLFNQFKNASDKAEGKDFAAMDKVWNRVEEKLEQKVLKKETKIWKKAAVAASVLLVVSLGYQFFKSEKGVVVPKSDVVTVDSTKIDVSQPVLEKEAVVSTESVNGNLKKDADKILEKQISTANVVVNETHAPAAEIGIKREAVVLKDKAVSEERLDEKVELDSKVEKEAAGSYQTARGNYYDAARAKYTVKGAPKAKDEIKLQTSFKKDPLYVIDGKAIVSDDTDTAKEKLKELSKMDADDIDSFIVLKEPLYIIDGKYYSEQELFGPNPTSPYSPLDIQEIVKTTVLQGDEATSVYGEKGKKGVVIITTKNGKPVIKK